MPHDVSGKEVITIRKGEYSRLGAGIKFEIEGNIFFSNIVKTKKGTTKKALFCQFYDTQGNQRTTSISGLKPVAGENGAYYFDTNNPKTRAYVNCDNTYYKLTVQQDTITIEGDL